MISIEYFAGFFDGEGTVTMVPKGSGFYLRLSVGNTNLEVLQEIERTFGGRVRKKNNGVNKPNFDWTITYMKAVLLAEKLAPFLIVKKKQAQEAIKLKKINLGPGAWKGKHADDIRAQILEIRKNIVAFNDWGGKKAVSLRTFVTHPATISTRKGWDRGRYKASKKIDEIQAREIASLQGKLVSAVVAKQFKVSSSLVTGIWRGTRWKHISDNPTIT